MNRISRPIEEIKDRYDAVVIGSGYGGGVAASRLSRAGRRVCLLERGAELLPGEYPSELSDLNGQVQIHTETFDHGPATALFDLRINRDVTAILGCGLGGTSLINANVSLEPDHRVFEAEHWPAAITPEVLEPYYEQARRMLEPTTYPADRPTPPKLSALQAAAERSGLQCDRAPINVNFVDKINSFGVYQPACNDCGNCCSGCNYGSKNTTLMNYLPDAARHGAEIFTLASVSYLRRDEVEGEWVVVVSTTGTDVVRTVRAPIVVLAAGALGSTEILLRSGERGLPLSPMLGHQFSTNGDMLAFGYDNDWKETAGSGAEGSRAPVYGVGAPGVPRSAAERPGPCITGVVRARRTGRVEDDRVIEEGVAPGLLASILPPAYFFAEAATGNPLQYGPADAQERLTAAQTVADALVTSPSTISDFAYKGPVSRSQTYLVMSHDDAGGCIELEKARGRPDTDRLRIVWPGAGAEPTYVADTSVVADLNAGIHGELLTNPLNRPDMGRQTVTVHPIGGCPMGDSWQSGVVDDRGRVRRSASDLHEGLYVCDGAVMPGSVAVNPLLTITALAERSMDLLIRDEEWRYDDSIPEPVLGTRRGEAPRPGHPVVGSPPGPVRAAWGAVVRVLTIVWHAITGVVLGVLTAAARWIITWAAERYPEAVSPGLSFRETMHGYVVPGPLPDPLPPSERVSNPFDVAAERGRASKATIDFELTIATDDIYDLVHDVAHSAKATGHVTCGTLWDGAREVSAGRFQLFPPDPDQVDTWLMTYDLPLAADEGPALHLHGTKYLRRTPGSSPWTDLTTLYVTITDENEDTVASGVMTLDTRDLVRQATTLQLTSRDRWFTRIGFVDRALRLIFLGKFAAFFGTTVLQAYGGVLADLKDFDETEDRTRTRRRLRAPDPVVHTVTTGDGRHVRLTRYRPAEPTRGPVVLAPGFSVSSTSFATDTTDVNLVEYLCHRNYDVWLFAYRACPDSGSSTTPFTLDDIVEYDWPAAIEFIREATGDDVQVVAHCVASMTVLMALLDGLSGVRSVVASQATVHPIADWLNDFKADVGLASLLRRVDLSSMGLDFRRRIDLRPGSTQSDRMLDTALWTVPVPEGEECTNPLCRRVFALEGPSWAHAQLNHATHVALREWFGPMATLPFEQLSEIVARGRVVDASGRDRYMPNVARLRDVPIDFVAGGLNEMFLPESSQRTIDWLQAHNPTGSYSRHVFPDYAHMDFWIGKRAHLDVFPYVVQCLEDRQDSAATSS